MPTLPGPRPPPIGTVGSLGCPSRGDRLGGALLSSPLGRSGGEGPRGVAAGGPAGSVPPGASSGDPGGAETRRHPPRCRLSHPTHFYNPISGHNIICTASPVPGTGWGGIGRSLGVSRDRGTPWRVPAARTAGIGRGPRWGATVLRAGHGGALSGRPGERVHAASRRAARAGRSARGPMGGPWGCLNRRAPPAAGRPVPFRPRPSPALGRPAPSSWPFPALRRPLQALLPRSRPFPLRGSRRRPFPL